MPDSFNYVHESNIKTKIQGNYHGVGNQLSDFLENNYYSMRRAIDSIDFTSPMVSSFREENGQETTVVRDCFIQAARIFNQYFQDLAETSSRLNISSQSKFESTYYEEISTYLFRDLPEVQTGKLSFYNKGIYAGLKIDSDYHISTIKKDVDFCIGKKVNLTISGQNSLELILPVIAVEVKTYLDATMFGEIKSSSKSIRSASPNSRTYVLLGYTNIADEHIIAARQDATITEMYALRKNEGSPIDALVLQMYFDDIRDAIESISADDTVITPGRLLFPSKQ